MKVTIDIEDESLQEVLSLDNPKFSDIIKKVIKESNVRELVEQTVFDYLRENLERITREEVKEQSQQFENGG